MRIHACLAIFLGALALCSCGGSDQPQPMVSIYKPWVAMSEVPVTGDFIAAMRQELAMRGIWVASSTCGTSVVPGAIGFPTPNGDKVGVVQVPESSVQMAAQLGYRPLSGLRYYEERDCEKLRLPVEPPSNII